MESYAVKEFAFVNILERFQLETGDMFEDLAMFFGRAHQPAKKLVNYLV